MQYLALGILTAAQALEKAAQRLFKPLGITPAQFNVLNLLAAEPDGLKSSDLAKALIVDKSNVTGLIKRMAADGLVHQDIGASDARQRILTLTKKGRAKWVSAVGLYQAGLGAVEAGLSRNDIKSTASSLAHIQATAAALDARHLTGK